MKKEKLIRIEQVMELTGLAKSTVWLWVKDKKLPKPIKLSPRVTVWKLSDIEQWIKKINRGRIMKKTSSSKHNDLKKTIAKMIIKTPIYRQDNGANYLVQDLIKDKYGILLPKYIVSTINSITRARNQYLKDNPIYDFRKVHKSKK